MRSLGSRHMPAANDAPNTRRSDRLTDRRLGGSPGLATMALRCRTEITAVGLVIVAAHVLTVSGTSHRTTLIRAVITAGVVMLQPETRRWVIDHAHCLLTRHRLYVAL